MLSTLLYPTEVDYTEDFLKHQFQLDKRKDLFKAIESAISKLGKGSLSFCFSLKLFQTFGSL